MRLLANAPVALETYQTVSGINGRASLNLAEREAAQITAAATHGCGFCVAGHTAVAEKKARLAPAVIGALRDTTEVPDPRLDAVTAWFWSGKRSGSRKKNTGVLLPTMSQLPSSV